MSNPPPGDAATTIAYSLATGKEKGEAGGEVSMGKAWQGRASTNDLLLMGTAFVFDAKKIDELVEVY